MRRRTNASLDDIHVYAEFRREARATRHENTLVERLQDDVIFEAYKGRFSSDHARRCARQLYRHPHLKSAFDLFVDTPGLWDGMRLSTVHKLINLRCEEEAVRYLQHHIGRIWLDLVDQDREALKRIDTQTVRAIELRCPRYSACDHDRLKRLVDSGEILASFTPQQRQIIWGRIKEVDCLIPSLFTFFEDIKLLQVWVDSMRHLVGPGPGAFRALQVLRGSASEDGRDFDDRVRMRADIRIRRLWIVTIRAWRALSPGPQRDKESLLARVPQEQADEIVLIRFARLADRLGFCSREIENLKQRPLPGERRSEDQQLVREDDAGDLESADGGAIENDQEGRSQYNGSIHVESDEHDLPHVQIDYLADAVVTSIINPATRRCGLPTEAAHERNRPLLCLQNLEFDYTSLNPYGLEITSFFALRSTYIAFFGHPTVAELGSDDDRSQTVASELQSRQSITATQPFERPNEQQARQPVGRSSPDGPTLGDHIMREMRQDEDASSDRTALADVQVEGTGQVSESSVDSVSDAHAWTDGVATVEGEGTASRDRDDPDQQGSIRITYRVFQNNRFETISEQLVNLSDAPVVAQEVFRFRRERNLVPFSTSLWSLLPEQCLESAVESGIGTIILLPESGYHITRSLDRAIAELRGD